MPEATYTRWAAARLKVTNPFVKRARSGDNSTVFEIAAAHTRWFLKIGDRLARECVEMLASALRFFPTASSEECPFEAYVPGDSLVHGDACLPNIIIGGDGSNGYIERGDMGVGDVEVDLSAAVWSLQYNLGPGFGLAFLRAYGRPDPTDRDAERLRVMYATTSA